LEYFRPPISITWNSISWPPTHVFWVTSFLLWTINRCCRLLQIFLQKKSHFLSVFFVVWVLFFPPYLWPCNISHHFVSFGDGFCCKRSITLECSFLDYNFLFGGNDKLLFNCSCLLNFLDKHFIIIYWICFILTDSSTLQNDSYGLQYLRFGPLKLISEVSVDRH